MPVVTTYWAIRHKPTGGYIPQLYNSSGRGGTHSEPTSDPLQPPRLFLSRVGAKLALVAWLKGKWERECRHDGLDYWERLVVVPVPDRKAEDMEIVELKLVYGG